MGAAKRESGVFYIQNLTWPQAEKIFPGSIAILPVGAIEAHGPHLPLGTDILISRALSSRVGEMLAARGLSCVILPTLTYTAAACAAAFTGTITVDASCLPAVLEGIAKALSGAKVSALAIANSHFDPAHRNSLREAVAKIEAVLPVAYPDYARKAHAVKLTDEFRSGACHAGQFETSLMLAIRGDLVRWDVAKALPDTPNSLTTAFKEGKTTFAEAGGPQAYFGYPSKATAAEGEKTLAQMATILADEVEELV